MAGLRTLDDILAGEELAAEKHSLVERWNARIEDRQAAGQPVAATKSPAGGGVTQPVPVLAGSARQRGLVTCTFAAGLLAIALTFVVTHKSADELARRGDAYRQAGNFESAVADYTAAIRLYINTNPHQPKLAAIYCNRGDVFLTRKEYARAIADYTEALRLEPQSTRALMGRVNAFRGEGNRGLGIADYIEAVRLNSENDLIWVNRGDELQRAGDAAAALQLFGDNIDVFQRLINAEPANTRWRRDLSLSYYEAGSTLRKGERLVEALETLRDSLEIARTLVAKDPTNSQLLSDIDAVVDGIGSISYHLVLKKDFPRALEAANLAISLSPRKLWLFTNQAHASMFLGRVEAARSIYLRYRGQKNVSGSDGWETSILNDFYEMRKVGLAHPLMNEIENRFGRRG